MIKELITKATENLLELREKAIRQNLVSKGFDPTDEFIIERCTILVDGRDYFLFVDYDKKSQVYICSWSDDVKSVLRDGQLTITL